MEQRYSKMQEFQDETENIVFLRLTKTVSSRVQLSSQTWPDLCEESQVHQMFNRLNIS